MIQKKFNHYFSNMFLFKLIYIYILIYKHAK